MACLLHTQLTLNIVIKTPVTATKKMMNIPLHMAFPADLQNPVGNFPNDFQVQGIYRFNIQFRGHGGLAVGFLQCNQRAAGSNRTTAIT